MKPSSHRKSKGSRFCRYFYTFGLDNLGVGFVHHSSLKCAHPMVPDGKDVDPVQWWYYIDRPAVTTAVHRTFSCLIVAPGLASNWMESILFTMLPRAPSEQRVCDFFIGISWLEWRPLGCSLPFLCLFSVSGLWQANSTERELVQMTEVSSIIVEVDSNDFHINWCAISWVGRVVKKSLYCIAQSHHPKQVRL